MGSDTRRVFISPSIAVSIIFDNRPWGIIDCPVWQSLMSEIVVAR